MKRFFNSIIITAGLAIFSMFFGAGNLMFPIDVGFSAGDKNIFAIAGFLVTTVGLLLVGLVSIILFNGDYRAFFNRLGKIPGELTILCCLLIIGPLYAMPRLITFSYTMMEPFLPSFVSLLIFSLTFIGLTFLATYKELTIIDLLGKIISPLLLICLAIIVLKGLFMPSIYAVATPETNPLTIFWKNVKYGFGTLDLLASIFFSAFVVQMLKEQTHKNVRDLATIGLMAGAIAATLLGIVYVGMSYLGVLHGHGLEHINPAQIFSAISLRILGKSGALVIGTAVLMACFSTIIALAAVTAEYIQKTVAQNKINYIPSLAIVLILTLIPSSFGLTKLLDIFNPVIDIFYPLIIVITFCNLAYKLFGFKPIKIPALLTLVLSIASYWW